jgi:LysM repeat protein
LSVAVALPFSLSAQSSEIECGTSYTVSPGDTLSKISIKAYGVSVFQVLQEANMESLGKNPNLLFVGQKILVPCRNATPVVEVAEPANEPVASQPYTDQSAQFDLVTSGQIDATYVYNGYLTDSHPLLQLPMIPLMGGSAEQTAVSL